MDTKNLKPDVGGGDNVGNAMQPPGAPKPGGKGEGSGFSG